MKLKHIFVALAATAATAPALAQTAPQVDVAVGAAVYGPQGSQVGTVEKVEGGNAVVNTGKNSAALPLNAFGKNEKGLLLSMTREQLDGAVEAAQAKADSAVAAALTVGAAVHSSDNQPMGTVKAISPEGVVTIERAEGEFSLRKDAFTTDSTGLALKNSKAAIDEAVNRQAAAAPTPAASPAPPAK